MPAESGGADGGGSDRSRHLLRLSPSCALRPTATADEGSTVASAHQQGRLVPSRRFEARIHAPGGPGPELLWKAGLALSEGPQVGRGRDAVEGERGEHLICETALGRAVITLTLARPPSLWIPDATTQAPSPLTSIPPLRPSPALHPPTSHTKQGALRGQSCQRPRAKKPANIDRPGLPLPQAPVIPLHPALCPCTQLLSSSALRSPTRLPPGLALPPTLHRQGRPNLALQRWAGTWLEQRTGPPMISRPRGLQNAPLPPAAAALLRPSHTPTPCDSNAKWGARRRTIRTVGFKFCAFQGDPAPNALAL